jgi:hypothetical protein
MEESDGVSSTQTTAGPDTAEGTEKTTVLVQMEEEKRAIRAMPNSSRRDYFLLPSFSQGVFIFFSLLWSVRLSESVGVPSSGTPTDEPTDSLLGVTQRTTDERTSEPRGKG